MPEPPATAATGPQSPAPVTPWPTSAPYYAPQWSQPVQGYAQWPQAAYGFRDQTNDERPERDHWYGWQPLVTDGIAIGLLAAGISAESEVIALAGVGLYGLGGPGVHLGHGRAGAAVISLAMRAGLPALGYAIPYAASGGHDAIDHHDLGGYGEGLAEAAGVFLGVTTAIVLDAAVLSHETIEERETSPTDTVSVSPVFDPHRRLAAVSVSGGF